ncbi:MAG: aldehyde dehydrogenase family protein [Oscillospiraceae bacterium]|nr:aldehyde dehydrogenase family protein [Oscillospiraceae bacterium]
MWTQEKIHALVQEQNRFFRSGKTLPVPFRLRQLARLRQAVLKYREKLTEALCEDLGRCKAEAYLLDIGVLLSEIAEAQKGLRKWAKPELKFSGIQCFPSVYTKIYKMPYGTALIISPFNFPVLLTLGVLTACIAGGNTAVLKTSSKSVHCTAVMQQMLSEIYPQKYVALVDGGHDTADLCLAERFDKIFYTGSPKVGVHVMQMAAKNLTPVALELGGETGNWCIVRKDADIRDAARKIAFMKLCNSGQICININQAAVAEEIAEPFLDALKQEFIRQIGPDPVHNPEYPHLISDAAYKRCAAEAEQYRDRIVFGGNGDPVSRKYAPTVIYPVRTDEAIVQHELFSPLLPVVPYPDAEIDALTELIASREHGLALYVFTKNRRWAEKLMSSQQYGGGCVNEVCLHLMVKGAPFGGTGHSGMGAYHGEWGFREFTHPSTVLYGSTHFNLSLREHPYSGKGAWKERILEKLER